MDGDAFNAAIENTTVGIYVLKEHEASEESEDIGVVLEGIRVLRDLDNIALAVAMLFGLMYALNISYPADLQYTFEVVQKILMDIVAPRLAERLVHAGSRHG